MMISTRKWWLLLGAALLPLSSFAQTTDGLRSHLFRTAVADTGINLINTGISYHKLTWHVVTAAAACTIALDTSADNITWTPGGAIAGQNCTADGASTVANVTANYVRMNMTALTVAGTNYVTVTWTGYVNAPGGAGSVTSITGTTPIVATPNPIIAAGDISCPTCVTAGGGGSITIADTQVAFGTGANTIGGSNNFVYDTIDSILDLTGTQRISKAVTDSVVEALTVNLSATSTAANSGDAAISAVATSTVAAAFADSQVMVGVAGESDTSVGAGGSKSSAIGIVGQAGSGGTGTTTNLIGGQFALSKGVGSTVTNAYGIDFPALGIGGIGSTISAAVHIGNQGIAATSYDIWTGGGKSLFNNITALAQAIAIKNTTPALVGTSQGSPHQAWCGTAFHGGASVEDCMDFTLLPGNGNDAAIAWTFAHTGTSTGTVTTTFPGPIASSANPGVANGAITIPGLTSGTATITVQNVAGTPTLTLGTSSGTPVVTASAPLAITAATGNITCATCVTTSGGLAFPVTVSGTTTSGGIPYFSSTTVLTSSAILNTNILVKGGGAGGAPTNSLATDTGTTLTYTGTGGLAAPVFTSTGTTAGFVDYPQGTTSVAVAPCSTANSVCVQAPTAVTSYLVNLPGVSATGIVTNNVAAAVDTQGFSGDANHSATVTTGSGTSVGSTILCSSANCPAGTYAVHVYIDITTACSTTGTYVVNMIYTDDQGAKTVPVNINGTGAVPATGVLTLSSTANFGENVQVLRLTSGNLNYSTTAGACGTGGPMVGKLYMAAVPVM